MGSQATKQLVYLVILGLVVFGCGPSATPTPTSPPTPTLRPTATLPPGATLATSLEDIVGTWVGLAADRMYQRFHADGRCFTSVSLENLDTQPGVESTCHFEGDILVTTDVKVTGLPSCGGTSGRYQVQLLGDGHITFV